MSGFLAFCRKELLEQVRTYRLAVLVVTFILVGLVSPLLAKVTPDLVGMIAEDELGGMQLIVTREPNVTDALLQYHGNFSLLPLLVILLVFGSISGEKGRKTAPMVLVKPVSRRSFLLAKTAVPAVMIIVGTLLAAGGCLLYTTVLFGEVDLAGFLVINAVLLLTLLSYLALALFGSVLTTSLPASAGVGLGGYVFFAIIGALPFLGKYTPAGLSGLAGQVIQGRAVSGLGWSIFSTILITALFLFGTDRILSRQEL